MSAGGLAGGWAKALGGDRKQFDMFFDKMLDGFAYHKIIVDKTGKPVDYVFLEVNQAFESMTGLKREKIIGKKVTAVLPGIEKDSADWIGVYGKVALTGEPVQFENHAAALGKWYKVSSYCPEKSHFVALFEDITDRKKTEEHLKESGQRYRQLFNSVTDMFAAVEFNYFIMELIHDKVGKAIDGIYREVNPATERLIGKTRDQLIGKSRKELFGEVNDEFPEKFDEVAKSGEPSHFETYGAALKKYYNVYVWKVAENQVGVILTDETERKKAEEALKRTNEELDARVQERTKQILSERQRLYNVLETLPSYVILLDKDYRVAFANKVFRERFGESYGRRCFEYLFKRDSPCENCETYKVLKTNGPHRWEWTGPDGRDYDVYDFPFIEANGSTLILEMGIDITERKRAEKQLRDASLYSRRLIEASLDPLVTINSEGKITDVNQATELATGCSKEELIGSDFSDYFTEPEKAKIGYKQVFTEGFVRDYPLAIRHKSGKIIDVLYNATIYTNEVGAMQGVFAAARDITELKKAEGQAQEAAKKLKDSERLAAIGATAGMVGHDIRNPLQAITGDVFLAKTELDSLPESIEKKNALESLQEIEKNIDYINKIVQDLQDYARPLKPNAGETDLKLIVAQLLEKNSWPDNIELSVKVENNAKKISADPYFINRILYNLVTNAVQAMPKGGKLTIHAFESLKDLVVTVNDTGVGIPRDIQGKMFTLMFTTKAKGQGFGLPVVKRMTESLGGAVTFESEEGKGTTFTVRLPLTR